MKLSDYAKTVPSLEGFPQGDTYIELDTADFEDFTFKDETGREQKKTKIRTNGREYYCPISVFRELRKIQATGGTKARVTRTGAKKEDTKYTTIEVKN